MIKLNLFVIVVEKKRLKKNLDIIHIVYQLIQKILH